MKLATVSLDDGGVHDKQIINLVKEVTCGSFTSYISSRLLLESVYEEPTMNSVLHWYDGVEVGCHGATHRRINVCKDELSSELDCTTLRDFFQQDVKCFAYPYNDFGGHWDLDLATAGIEYARTCVRGEKDLKPISGNRYRQPITCMYPSPSDQVVSAAITGGFPIHIATHPWWVVKFGLIDSFANLLKTIVAEGYSFVENSRFFKEMCP